MARQRWQAASGSWWPVFRRSREATPDASRTPTGRWQNRQTGPSALRRIVGVVLSLAACLLAVGAVFVLISLLRLPCRPTLVVLSGSPTGPLAEANPFAVRDVQELARLDNRFQVVGPTPANLTANELRAAIQALPDAPRPRTFLRWQPTLTVVYVNALGLTVSRDGQDAPVPYLLPKDAMVDVDASIVAPPQAVPVASLLERLSQVPTTYKLLVLDCQQVEQFWPAGVLSNALVESVERQIQEHAKDHPGLLVLFSCSPGETAWNDPLDQHSVFAQFFLRGITGSADRDTGDGNGRLNLQELHDYLQQRVSQWTEQHRLASQQPRLLATDVDPAEVELTTVSSSELPWQPNPDTEAVDGELESVQKDLTAAWESYYTSARQQPASLTYAPQLWRLLEEALLDAESEYVNGNSQAVATALQTAAAKTVQIQSARKKSQISQRAYSLPMIQLFAGEEGMPPTPDTDCDAAQSDPEPATSTEPPTADAPASKDAAAPPAASPAAANSDASDAKSQPSGPSVAGGDASADKKQAADGGDATTPLTTQQVADIVRQVTGGGPVDVLGKPLVAQPYEALVLPVEGELVRMMAANWPQLDPQQAGILRRIASATVKTRSVGEQVAAFGGDDAPEVFLWVAEAVNKADEQQLQREDRYFALAGPPPRKLDQNLLEEFGPDFYAGALSDARVVADAYRLRNHLLAELPYLVRFSAAQPTGGDWAAARQIVDLTNRLLQDAEQLVQTLDVTPHERSADQRRSDIQKLSDLNQRMQKQHGQLLGKIDAAVQSLAVTAGKPASVTAVAWRRADALRRLPMAGSDQPATNLAQRRLALLELLRTPVPPPVDGADAAHVTTADPAASDQQLAARRDLALAFYRLALPGSTPASDATAPVPATPSDPLVRETWQRLFRSAQTPEFGSRSTDQRRYGALAARILEPNWIEPIPQAGPNAATLERQQRLAELINWHGERRAGDQWQSETPLGERYSVLASRDYRELAQRIAPESLAQTAAEYALSPTAQIALQDEDATASPPIQVQPEAPVFRGRDTFELRLGAAWSHNLPTDTIDLRLTGASEQLEAQRLSPDDNALPFRYQLTRKTPKAFSQTLAARAFVRGRWFEREIYVQGIDVDAGATVVYENSLPSQGLLRVGYGEVDRQPASILFVLDSSRSMAQGGRMEILKRTLEGFADQVSQNGLRVGVRVFGARQVWQEDDLQSEALARRDTQLVMPLQSFQSDEFSAVVSQLQPVGESPLFQAVLDGRDDLKPTSGERLSMIVVSDGADNWALAGLEPNIQQIGTAFYRSSIAVNTIGFRTDEAGFQQLQRIAAFTGGKCLRASEHDELLSCILDLADFRQYDVTPAPEKGPTQPAPLLFTPQDLTVNPGDYHIRVMDHQGEVVSERTGIVVAAGQQHDLQFTGGQLKYPVVDPIPSLAVFTDAKTGVRLIVRRAQLEDATMSIEVSLDQPGHAEWQPRGVRWRVQPENTETIYTIERLPPNVPGYHYPVWRLDLANWPVATDLATIEASWYEKALPQRTTYELDWSSTSNTTQPPLPTGYAVTRKEVRKATVDGKQQSQSVITLEIPLEAPSLLGWTIEVDEPVAYLRQNYDPLWSVVTARFQLSGGDPPAKIRLLAPESQPATVRLSGSVNLRPPQVGQASSLP